MKDAPVHLLYLAYNARLRRASQSQKDIFSAAHAGFIGQNVYLFCASEGLATVVRASVDRKELAVALKLPAQKRITLAQTVGYPGTAGK